MGVRELEQFLANLDVQGHVTESTRNQALSALQFLYREVLQLHSDHMQKMDRVKSPAKSPVMLTADEMNRLLLGLSGSYWLMASLLYGTDMQMLQCVRLRAKDVSSTRNEILIRDGKDKIVRRLSIPPPLQAAMKAHMEKVFETYREDMKSNWQGVYMPDALQIEHPNSSKLFAWQYVFVANRLPHDPRDHKIRRYHIDAREFQRALLKAALDAGLNKRFNSHSLRPAFRAGPTFQAT